MEAGSSHGDSNGMLSVCSLGQQHQYRGDQCCVCIGDVVLSFGLSHVLCPYRYDRVVPDRYNRGPKGMSLHFTKEHV
jgi:hypothetical protein